MYIVRIMNVKKHERLIIKLSRLLSFSFSNSEVYLFYKHYMRQFNFVYY